MVMIDMVDVIEDEDRYERLLRRAKTEDLSEVSGIGCLYQSGIDRQGRPVVVFVGKWFPATKINLDKTSNERTLLSHDDLRFVVGAFHREW